VGYKEDYKRECQKLQELWAERERIRVQERATLRRVVALATMLNLPPEDVPEIRRVGAPKRGALTDTVRCLLLESGKALTTKTTVGEMQKLGFTMTRHANPSASVNSICNRLVEQGFARECKLSRGQKGKAWVQLYKAIWRKPPTAKHRAPDGPGAVPDELEFPMDESQSGNEGELDLAAAIHAARRSRRFAGASHS
jgi:hypothetical protein